VNGLDVRAWLACLHGPALLAIGRLKVACAAVAGSSLLAALAQVVQAEVVPAHVVVAALALGNTIGMTGAAIPLVIGTRRIRGPAAVRGAGRAVLAALASAIAGAVAGAAISVALPASNRLMDAVVGVLPAGCAPGAGDPRGKRSSRPQP